MWSRVRLFTQLPRRGLLGNSDGTRRLCTRTLCIIGNLNTCPEPLYSLWWARSRAGKGAEDQLRKALFTAQRQLAKAMEGMGIKIMDHQQKQNIEQASEQF